MKKLLLLISFTLMHEAFAAVDITSFYFVQQGSRLAEICGVVQSPRNEANYVRITVDPKGRRPGIYNTVAGVDGRFCLTVVTYSGFAEARLFDENVSKSASIHSLVK